MNLYTINILNIRNGINQNEASAYTIVKLYFEQADEQPNATPNAQADEQTDEHIITKLNLLFNYIYINNKSDEEELELLEKDKLSLIAILKRLEMYTDNVSVYDFMSAERLLDEKIMIWAIKETYQSPYKVYLNNLDREKFVLKYQKTKKYITENRDYKLEEIIKYFIVCLHEELENSGKEQK